MISTNVRTRHVAMVTYLCYALAGVAFLVFPSETLREGTTTWSIIVWHVFLLTGSAISAFGAFKKRLITEAIGLPLLGASFLAYSVVLFAYASGGNAGARVGVGLLILALFIGAVGRFIDLYRLVRIADEVGERTKDETESEE